MATDNGHPEAESADRKRSVTIHVNKHRVVMHEQRATGMDIKAAAIAQGVAIQPDYSLFVVQKDDSLEQVGDTQWITLHEGEHFSATAPDDNS